MISLKALEKLAVDNSPALLTAIGVAGTIGTAILSHKAATKAERLLSEESPHLTRKERASLVWKYYIPPVVSGSLTISATILANHIGTKRAAAVAAAYTISEKAYAEYREKVVEKIGENQERKIRDEVVQDRVRNDPLNESNVVLIGSGEVLCYELYTGRYFNSSVEEIKKAMNDTNYQINNYGYASMSDFYDRIGLPRTAVSDEMGWAQDKLMDIDFTTVLSEDGRPCVAINFQTSPVRDYHRFR